MMKRQVELGGNAAGSAKRSRATKLQAAGPKAMPGRRALASDQKTSLPVYYQLYITLRRKIQEGELAPGALMPAEPALSEQFGVSRVTLRRTFQMLEQEGLILRRRSLGTFVADRKAAQESIKGPLTNLVTLGVETAAETLSFEPHTPLPAYAALSLGLPADTLTTHVRRLRRHDGKPFSLTSVYVLERLGVTLTQDVLDDRPVVWFLEDQGVRATKAEQNLTAVLADDSSAEHLGVTIGSPLLKLRRFVYDQAGQPLLYQQGLYQPDLYQYRMSLTRSNSNDKPSWQDAV
jgi:GntR family transcriptional regulator